MGGHFPGAIALRVMVTLGREGIRVLPVHDSFIVPFNMKDRLRTVMEDTFREFTGTTTGIVPDKTIEGFYTREGDDPEAQSEAGHDPQWAERLEDDARSLAYSLYRERG